MPASAIAYTLIPAAAAVAGSAVAVNLNLRPTVLSGLQHFAAGVVFAAAAVEILPDVLHGGSPTATIIGGLAGVAVMLFIKRAEALVTGSFALLAMVGVDLVVDGLVLGIGFAAGDIAGVLLTVALSIEILFLGLTAATGLHETVRSKAKVIGIVALLMIGLPIGAALAVPIAQLPGAALTGVFAFGLMALLYLVTEELLVEAHETPDTPMVVSMFFVGFLIMLVLAELMSEGGSAVS